MYTMRECSVSLTHNAGLAIGEMRAQAAAGMPRRLADPGVRGHPMVSHRRLTLCTSCALSIAQKAGPGSSGRA